MMNVKVIGVGAAGNKAVINLVEKGIIPNGAFWLINSTDKDIPSKYRQDAYIFGGDINGCGKERELASGLISEEINQTSFGTGLTKFISKEDKIVFVISSTEGGTGSGSSIHIAKYIQQQTDINIHMIGILGFEDDPKGMENTINWCKELDKDFIVSLIDNKKFLSAGSKEKAEIAANDEIAKRINILLGNTITESNSKNIDATDLFKITTQTGYMIVESASIAGIECKEDFNSILKDMVKSSKSLPTKPKSYIMGIIINCKPKTMPFIDESFSVIYDAYGSPYETHFHYEDVGGEESISIISAGMDRPVDEIKALIDRYNAKTSKVNFDEEDGFDDTLDSFEAKSKPRNNPFGKRLGGFKLKRRTTPLTIKDEV